MVSTLDSRASGPGSSPGQGHCVVFSCARHFTVNWCLSPPRCILKWLLVNLMLGRGGGGVTLPRPSIPSRGSRNISSCFMLWPDGPQLACMQTLPSEIFTPLYTFHLKKVPFLGGASHNRL